MTRLWVDVSIANMRMNKLDEIQIHRKKISAYLCTDINLMNRKALNA